MAAAPAGALEPAGTVPKTRADPVPDRKTASVEACAGKALHSAVQWVTDGLPRLGHQPADEGAQDKAAVAATLHGVTALAMSLRPRRSISSR